MQELLQRITFRMFNRLDNLSKSKVLRKIHPVFYIENKDVVRVAKQAKRFERQWKDAKIAEINDIIKTNHSKLRISERFI